MSQQSIIINNWTKGISDDAFLWEDGTFQTSESIDIRRNPKWIQLTSAENNEYNVDWIANAIVDMTKHGVFTSDFLLVFTENGSIYKNGVRVASGFNAFMNGILMRIWGTSTIICFTYTQAYKISVADANSNSLDSWNANLSLLGGSNSYGSLWVPVVCMKSEKNWGIVVFWSWRQLFKIDISAWNVTNLFSTQTTSEFITWITEFSDQITVYTKLWSQTQAGRQYIFNANDFAGNSVSPEYTINWESLPIKTVENVWNTDLAITWYGWPFTPSWFNSLSTKASLYGVSWYQKQLVRKNVEGKTKLHFFWQFPNSTTQSEWIVYLPSANWVFSYGAYLAGFPSGMTLDYPLTSTDTTNEWIHSMEVNSDKLFVGYNDGTNNKVSTFKFVPTTYASSGNLVTRVLTWWNIGQEKNLTYIKVWYDLTDALGHWGTIDIQIRNVIEWSWQSVGSISDATQYTRHFYQKEMPFNNWNTLEIRAILNSWDSQTKTPVLYDIEVGYDLIDRK